MIAKVIGEGTPLVMLHGFGVDHRILLPLEGAFDGMGVTDPNGSTGSDQWQRIYVDMAWAQGGSDSGASSPREIADQVLEEVTEIVGNRKFAILGNSFGAMVARHIAFSLADQCIGLATLVGAFQMDHGLRVLPQREVVLFDQDVLDAATARAQDFEFMAVIHTAQALELFTAYVAPGLEGANEQVIERLQANYTDAYSPETSGTPPFMAPAVHLFGKQDHVVGFEDGLAVSAHYPNGEFLVIDGGGHHLQLEQPQIVNSHINRWLKRIEEFAALMDGDK